jgi:hypothetical protein
MPTKPAVGVWGPNQVRKERQLDVRVRGLPEYGVGNDGGNDDQSRTDEHHANSVEMSDEARFKDVCVTGLGLTVQVESMKRVGSHVPGRPRTLIVKLKDANARRDLLRSAWRLKDTEDYNAVYLSPDYSYQEDQENYRLRCELRRLRDKATIDKSSAVYSIRRGSVVLLNE